MILCTIEGADSMIIRQHQMETLAHVAENGYVSCAVKHLEGYDPPLAATAGRAALDKIARQGLAAARGYGLSGNRALQLYLELMLSLGCGFDTDPQFRWIHSYLKAGMGVGAVERVRLLQFHTAAYLDRAYGPEREFSRAALGRAVTITQEQLLQMGDDLDAKAGRLLEWIHPQRAGFVDPEAVGDLLAGARKEANAYNLPPGHGVALVFLLKFAFGHLILSDPVYTWLIRNVESEGAEDASLRFERLVARLRAYGSALQSKLGSARL